jgi:hypothetical protein
MGRGGAARDGTGGGRGGAPAAAAGGCGCACAGGTLRGGGAGGAAPGTEPPAAGGRSGAAGGDANGDGVDAEEEEEDENDDVDAEVDDDAAVPPTGLSVASTGACELATVRINCSARSRVVGTWRAVAWSMSVCAQTSSSESVAFEASSTDRVRAMDARPSGGACSSGE